ncbi:MAG: hypothetical protein AAGF46_07345 [Pseudomonadota bacterium]
MPRLFTRLVLSACSLALACTATQADDSGYILGAGMTVDNGDGYGVTGLFDYIFNDATSVSLAVGAAEAAALPDDVTTRFWSVGFQHDFGGLGVDLRGGQSGDPSDFDSDDLDVGLFHQGEHWRLAAGWLRRDIDLTFRLTPTRMAREFSLPLKADGWRAAVSYRTESRWRWSVRARQFDYDRDPTLLGTGFVTQRLSPTTLTLTGTLLDSSYAASVEIPFKKSRALSLGVARDVLAGDLAEVETLTLGWLTPAGERGDLDMSLGISRADGNADETTVFVGILYLFYGGFD